MNFRNDLRHATEGVNIPPYERILTVALGAAAMYFGARHRGIFGWALAAAGSGLAARGVSGHCPAYRKMMSEQDTASDTSSRTGYGSATGTTSGIGATTRPQV